VHEPTTDPHGRLPNEVPGDAEAALFPRRTDGMNRIPGAIYLIFAADVRREVTSGSPLAAGRWRF
jgi:hypothetical protein